MLNKEKIEKRNYSEFLEYLESLTEEMKDMSTKEIEFREEICRRSYALMKIDPSKSIYTKNKFLKKSNFPKWFPEELRDSVIRLSNGNKIGLVIRICPDKVVKKFFTSYQLKGYWKSVFKRTRNLRDVELSWIIMLPLYCYILTTHEKKKVNKLTNLQYKEKLQLISKKSKELFDSINELDCDLNIIDLFLRNNDGSDVDLSIENNTFADLYCNRTNLSDVLHFYSTLTNKMKGNCEYVLPKPNIKHSNETYFVKVFCKFNLEIFKTPYHEHTRDLANILFDKEFSKDNIKSKTKKLRNSIHHTIFINDDFREGSDLVSRFITEKCNSLSGQFFIHPLIFALYKDFDYKYEYDESEVEARSIESFVIANNYDLDYKKEKGGTYRLETLDRKIHSNDEGE